MSSHHKHAEPKDGQRGAVTDQEDHDTLTVSILVSRDNRPNIQYPKKGRRLCVDNRERGGVLEVEGDASYPPILTKPIPGSPLSSERSGGTGKRGKTVAHILYKRRKKVPEDRKGDPHPSHRILKATPISPRAPGNREDGFADKTSTQKAGSGGHKWWMAPLGGRSIQLGRKRCWSNIGGPKWGVDRTIAPL
ncbi:hypothetical protein CR513_13895, partial [Mucuna pruriens]